MLLQFLLLTFSLISSALTFTKSLTVSSYLGLLLPSLLLVSAVLLSNTWNRQQHFPVSLSTVGPPDGMFSSLSHSLHVNNIFVCLHSAEVKISILLSFALLSGSVRSCREISSKSTCRGESSLCSSVFSSWGTNSSDKP